MEIHAIWGKWTRISLEPKKAKKVLESIEFEMGFEIDGFEIESIKQLRRFFERAKIERKEGANDVNDY